MYSEHRISENLPKDATEEQIALAAEGLNRRNFEPIFLLPVKNFFFWKRADMIQEFTRLLSLPENAPELQDIGGYSPKEAVERQLSLLLYYYDILHRLRLGDATAWDIVNELYEDD